MTRNEALTTLEDMVDAFSADDIVTWLGQVCAEKADHIQSSYAIDSKSDPDAELWATLAHKLSQVPNLGI